MDDRKLGLWRASSGRDSVKRWFSMLGFWALASFNVSAIGGETFYVKSRTDCAWNGDGRLDRCAVSNGSAGAWRGSTSVVYGRGRGQVDGSDTVRFTGNWIGIEAADGGQTYEITIQGSGVAGSQIVFDFSKANINCLHQVQRGISVGAEHDYTILSPRVVSCGTVSGYGISIDGGVSSFDLNVRISDPVVTDITGTDKGTVAIRGKGAHFSVHNPKIDGVSDDGIWIDGDAASVSCDENDGSACYIKNVGLGGELTGDCIQYGATPATSLNASIAKVYCDHRARGEKQCFISNGLGLLSVTDSVCLMPPFDGETLTNGIYAEGAVNVRRNFIEGARIGVSTAMRPHSHPIETNITSNIVRNTGFRGISIGHGALSSVVTNIFNNTILCDQNARATGVHLDGRSGARIAVTNNLVVGCDVAFGTGGGRIEHSIAFNNDFRSRTRFKISGDAGNNFTFDPLWIGAGSPTAPEDFRLRGGSRLEKAGACLEQLQDFSGQPFSCPSAIGALGKVN
jgi:hypothetical protein